MALWPTLATPMYVRFIQYMCNVNALCKHLCIYIALGLYFSYKNLFIRIFIYHEKNTFGLPKFSKISFAFNIFVPNPVQEMVYLKVIQKNRSNGHFCVGNHQSKNASEKHLRGASAPLTPLDPPMTSPNPSFTSQATSLLAT